VLVIDDDATIRMVLTMGLRAHGYACLTAENGRAAQLVLQSHRPEVILVDLLMPIMDGLTFIQWLRSTARDSTPVLVFSNVHSPKITQEALASGANAFACKPLHLRELVEMISQLVPN
jgi:DNA-binding response OmpR family regulator